MISVVVPRPIAWVSTVAPDGTTNAAPFSYFQALSSVPPVVMIAVGRKREGVAKDTRTNIEATREFVVNVVSEESAARMVKTSVAYDHGVSEFDEVGLGAAPSVRVRPPRIAECAVALECRLDRVIEVGTTGVLVGEVVLFHLRDDVVGAGGTVDPVKLRPLGRLGGTGYMPLREVWDVTPEAGPATTASDLLDVWRELRAENVAMCRAAGGRGPGLPDPDALAAGAPPEGREATKRAILDEVRLRDRCARR
jgi:flavin reductase (DIM6/NTAB) family NADH-FMN oxidoreductase RutF